MIIKLIRLLFFPVSILYGLIISLRNYQFDNGLKSSLEMEPAIIAVGNLSTGGTGKTPMIEYLIRLLKTDYDVATISRGYGRKTKGYRLVDDSDTATTVGDEPLQYHKKFGKDVHVVVSEQRVLGVSSLMLEYPEKNVFLLDDAYQHRFLKRDLNILLTSFNELFFNDWLLPTGNLREPRSEAKRADAIIITKCPRVLTDDEKSHIETRVDKYNKSAPIFYSSVNYGEPEACINNKPLADQAILISGIVDPIPLQAHLEQSFQINKHFRYPDHYQFRNRDLDSIEKHAVENDIQILFTTEKDMVRLLPMKGHSIFKKCTLYYIPIEVSIDKSEAFNELVIKSLKGKVNL